MKLRAFVFDDDPLVRSLFGIILEKREYEVFTFSDPGLCPFYTSTVCPCSSGQTCADLIISDLDMFDVLGLDVVECQVNKGCQCQHIALLSGAWTAADRKRAGHLGCQVFTKPFYVEQIDLWLDAVEPQIDPRRQLFDWFRPT